MKTWLVTGGAGFIGSNFILSVIDKNPEVSIVNLDLLTYAGNLDNLRLAEGNPRYRFVQGDIGDCTLCGQLFKKYDINTVVNFAAESHVDRSIVNPEVFARTNVLGTLNLLNTAKKAWSVGEDRYREGTKFVQVSTDEVYGSLGEEGYFLEATPLDPHSPYSASKASADLFVKAYADTYKMPVNITRCSNNYGPYQFPEKLIPLIIHNCLNHKPLPVYGDGMQVRDWLYVSDHGRAIEMVIERGRVGEVYNVGGHNEKANIEIVKSIVSYIHEHVDDSIDEDLITYVEDRKGHDRRYGIDSEKISRELGWQPQIMFEDGIKTTIQWYLENPEWMNRVTSGAYQSYYEKMYNGY